MKRRTLIAVVVAVLALAITGLASDLSSPAKGTIITPPSSIVGAPGKVHTPLYIFIPDDKVLNNSIPNGETPYSIACIYGVVPPTSGCPKGSGNLPTGGAKAIAVIEYGTYSNVQSDLNTFDAQFGLPNTTIVQLCWPSGQQCQNNAGTGWDIEEALDVQYAHAMAPNATIIVSSFSDDPLTDGSELGAAQYIAAHYGAGEVSNSWGYNGGENWCGSGNCELSYDSYFVQNGVVFFASAGDSGYQVNYPSVSPNIISAGGTYIERDSNGNFTGNESCWSGSGGGISQYEPLPQFQLFIGPHIGTKRGVPDWALDADPNSGVDIYSSTYCGGWCIVGGTSVASPTLAGIVNQAGHFQNNNLLEVGPTYIYYNFIPEYSYYFYDVKTGSNGHPATWGWDTCTGLGTIRHPSGF